ncbi:hypothetical protein GCM10023081_27470 [Arthrobacter ginkgonis]|uniref:Uncharacterized protein n=1 Tax=Arthrobacter ginkgonis TaxID=1630594 RepID=A0ABP7CE27_9MICC
MLVTQASRIAWTTRGGGGEARMGAGAVLDISGRGGFWAVPAPGGPSGRAEGAPPFPWFASACFASIPAAMLVM